MKERFKKLLNEARELVGIEDNNFQIMLNPMRRKIASISFKTKIIRLNKEIASKLDNEAIRYILIHELIHYKIRSLHHNEEFWRELERIYPINKIQEIENLIINSAYSKAKHPL